jgi:hypothetical protein
LIANEKNRLRWLVLGLSQDGACIDLFEKHSENSLKEDLSNITTFNLPLFSLVSTFKVPNWTGWVGHCNISLDNFGQYVIRSFSSFFSLKKKAQKSK